MINYYLQDVDDSEDSNDCDNELKAARKIHLDAVRLNDIDEDDYFDDDNDEFDNIKCHDNDEKHDHDHYYNHHDDEFNASMVL